MFRTVFPTRPCIICELLGRKHQENGKKNRVLQVSPAILMEPAEQFENYIVRPKLKGY